MSRVAAADAGVPPLSRAMDPRTLALLDAPILPLLLRLAWPNVLVMLAQAATGLIETWFVGRLGTDALAGMALVFPGVMLMQMLSAGAIGGGISSATARALGRGDRRQADAVLLNALVINGVVGALFAVGVLLFGRPLYRALGGSGGAIEAALAYSNVVFAGNVLLWVMNALASSIRGTGNMLVPALVLCGGVVLLLPLSPLLIFGYGPFPGYGIAGGGIALVLFYAAGTAILAWYCLRRGVVRMRWVRPSWAVSREILRVGAFGSISSLQTNVVIGVATALAGFYGGNAAVAGYGTGARLEYLLVPLVFGVGAPLVAMVGTNIGAGRNGRALRITAWGGGLAFAMTEAVGLAAAIWPGAWLSLFDRDPAMVAAGSDYLRAAGPFYGFFGLGLSLYFASQGAGRLLWPLAAGFVRMVVALGGGWALLASTGSFRLFSAAIGAGMLLYGLIIAAAVARGTWFREVPGPAAPAALAAGEPLAALSPAP